MSFDLAFWHTDSAIDAGEAAEIYKGIIAEVPDVVAANPAVERFHADVVGVFPDLTEENMDESPWMAELYFSPSFLVVNISWSKRVEVSEVLLRLSRKHGLVCYDPQGEAVFS